jgi:hypothetical protein
MIASGELEISMLAEAAATGVATTLALGQDVEPVSLAKADGERGEAYFDDVALHRHRRLHRTRPTPR